MSEIAIVEEVKTRPGEDAELRLDFRADGQLWATVGEREVAVRVRRCFPWSAPDRFLSLCDGDDEEVALVRSLAELDPESKGALERSLREVGFVVEVEGVEHVDDEIEIRTFRVRTRDGVRSFQTLRDEWPREMPDGALLIKDVAGDLYRVADPKSLDPLSRKKLAAFID